MTFAATYEDPPRVWGVGRVVVGDEIVPWPVSEADIDLVEREVLLRQGPPHKIPRVTKA